MTRAEGAILAHSLMAGSLRLRKGEVLTGEHVAALKTAGLGAVTVLRLEAGDVGENEAARRLAEALAGPGLELSRAFTGRTNLVAATAGLAQIDAERIDALNRIDEALTVATVRPLETVFAGDLVATVKVIPFAVRGAVLDRAIEVAGRARAISLSPFRRCAVGLVQHQRCRNQARPC